MPNANEDLEISTATVYDLKLNINAKTDKTTNIGTKPIRVTICDDALTKITSSPTPILVHVYAKDSHSGEKVSNDV